MINYHKLHCSWIVLTKHYKFCGTTNGLCMLRCFQGNTWSIRIFTMAHHGNIKWRNDWNFAEKRLFISKFVKIIWMIRLLIVIMMWNRTWFFVDKDQKFYERGMIKLPEWWQKIIGQNGKYIRLNLSLVLHYKSFLSTLQ